MARDKDYYALLGVSTSASAEEIRRAYRGLARKYHPDVNKAPEAATRFAEMQEAYDVLSDAEKRKAYDRFGHAGVGVGAGPGGFGHAGVWTTAGVGLRTHGHGIQARGRAPRPNGRPPPWRRHF